MPRYVPGTIQIRRMSSAQWAALDPILADGELGYDTTTGALKVGDGHSRWSELPTFAGPAGPKGEKGDTGQPGALSLQLADNSLVNTGTTTNPILAVGDLSGLYASAADLQGLSDQQTQLMAKAASIDELTISAEVQGVWISHTWTETLTSGAQRTFWVAPFACRVVSCAIMTDFAAIDADASNYLKFTLRRERAGVNAPIVEKTTSDEAISARTGWNLDGATWDPDNSVLAKDDGLAWNWNPSGTASLQLPFTVTCRIVPA